MRYEPTEIFTEALLKSNLGKPGRSENRPEKYNMIGNSTMDLII